VNDQRHPRERQRVEPGINVTRMVDEAIADVRLSGFAHTDEVGGKATAFALEPRNHVPPEIRRGGIAVQENDGIAGSCFAVVNGRIEDVEVGHVDDTSPAIGFRLSALASRQGKGFVVLRREPKPDGR
jgi:hypothetical protein